MAILHPNDPAPIGPICVTEIRVGVAREKFAAMRAFYEEVLLFEPWPPQDQLPGAWGLGPRRGGILLLLQHDPRVDRVARRFSILVPDLPTLEKRFETAGIPFERTTSLGVGENVVAANDPQGYRLEFRQSRRL